MTATAQELTGEYLAAAPGYLVAGEEKRPHLNTVERAAESGRLDAVAKRLLDLSCGALLLLVLLPVMLVLALAIVLDSRGPVFYRSRRVGQRGREFAMLKFRKMYDGARGLPLTVSGDERLTRLGRLLAATKLDELPQLWNVLKGEMSLVGPRPEDPEIVALERRAFDEILCVKPGITGLSQLAFADESSLLDRGDTIADYLDRLLPMKLGLDRLYRRRRTFWMDLRILVWTALAIVLRLDVAVNRASARLSVRRRIEAPVTVAATEPQLEEATVAVT